MKRCFKCGTDQPLDQFYKHPRTSDGLLNKCKTCAKADGRLRRLVNIDGIRAYEKSRANSPQRIEARRRYAKSHPDRRAEISLEWARNNPVKRQAQNKVNNAVRKGRLRKQPCARCGSKEYVRYDRDGELVTTNTAEGFFGNSKRNISGTHRHISRQHTDLYFAELDHKYNTRLDTDGARTNDAVSRIAGKRLMLRKPKDK